MFGGVESVVRRNGVDADNRRGEIHRHAARGRGAVSGAVLRGGANRVAGAIRQCCNVRRRHVHTPAPVVLNGSAVAFAVKQHGHHRACRKISARAAQGQRTARFGGVNNIIAADGADRERHCRRVYLYVVRLGAAVACAIGDSGADSHCAICKAGNHAGRHANAPVAAGIGAGDILLPGDGHHQAVARHRARGGATDNLRLSVFDVVNHIIARHGVKADDGRGGINGHTFAGAARVTRLIADRGGQGVAVIGKRG